MGDEMVDWFSNKKSPSWDIGRKCLDPLVHVRMEDDEIIVTADLPLVRKEDIDLTVENKNLIIKAKTKKDIKFKNWGGIHRRVSFNSFRKEIRIPSTINPDETEAEFTNGILKVRLSKKKGNNQGKTKKLVIKTR